MVKLAIDGGHGNFTPGKRAPDDSMREFHFNNPVAQMVGSLLMRNYEGVEILHPYDLTGKTDTPLDERTGRANRWGADGFVSIHANAFGSSGFNSVSGIETFIYEGPVSQKSVELAANVQNHLIRDTGRKNRGVKRANFAVLRLTRMPAILVECGFMTNVEELALLKSDSYRTTCALAIVKGIVETFKLREKTRPVAPAPSPGTAAGGGDLVAGLYQPNHGEMVAATSRVLERLETSGVQPIDPIHRVRLEAGKLTISDALGLLYVAIDRGYLDLKGGE